MKKYWSLLIVTVALSTVSFAQNCSPDGSIVKTGVYPTVTEGFKDGYVNTPYEQVVQIKVIKDTIIEFNGSPTASTVFYAVIDSVKGLPASLDYVCNPTNCEIPGGDVGCTVLHGTPTNTDLYQTYNLTIFTTLYGLPNAWIGVVTDPIPFQVEFDNYSVTVLSESESVIELTPSFESNVYPNPLDENLTIEVNATATTSSKVTISSLLGEVVLEKEIQINSGNNSFQFNQLNLAKGVYMVELNEGGAKRIHKIIKK